MQVSAVKSLTLISSFYNVESVVKAVHKLSPSKIVLIVNVEEDDVCKKSIVKLKSIYGKVMAVEVVKVDIYDVVKTAETMAHLIISEHAQNRVVVNVTGGRKIAALGVLFGAYARSDLVEKIVYGNEDSTELFTLPKMSFALGKTKKAILKDLESGRRGIPQVAKRLGISEVMTYNHLKELKADGFLNDDYTLTQAGQLALI